MPFRDAASSRACGGAINDVVAVVGSPYFLSRSRSVPRFRPSRRAAVDWFQKTAASVSAMTRRSSASICSFNERRRSGGVSAAGSLRTNRSGALGECLHADLAAAAERHHPCNGVFELPHVAGPFRFGECLDQLRRKTNVLVAEALRISSPELGGESKDVFAALAKRRDDHFDHCQTVVQVFPEASCGGLRF